MATTTVQAPTVRKIGDIYNSLAPAINPSIALQKEQLDLIQPQLDADIKGAEQAKVNEFRNITNLANRRGLTFSGIPIQEQARYIGEKFLPAVQALKLGAQKERIKIRDIIAGIQRDAYMQAFNTQEGDRDKVFTYNQGEADRQFSQSERIAGQEFTAGQNALDRALQEKQINAQIRSAQISAASRSSGSSSSKTEFDQAGVVGVIADEMGKVAGRDGYVSPRDYQDARIAWAQAGGNSSYFDSIFGGYANPSHIQDYIYK